MIGSIDKTTSHCLGTFIGLQRHITMFPGICLAYSIIGASVLTDRTEQRFYCHFKVMQILKINPVLCEHLHCRQEVIHAN